MAFCERCGKQLADGEVCTCMAGQQSEAPGAAPVGNAQPVGGAAPANGNKKKWLIAIPVAAAVLLIIIISALSSKPYMEPVEDFMKLMNKRSTNVEKMLKLQVPGFAKKEYAAFISAAKKSDDFEDILDDTKEYLEDSYEDADDEFEKWKLSFELKKAEKMDKDDLEDLKDYLEDFYDDYLEDTVDDIEDELDDEDELEDLADELDMSEKEVKKFAQAYIKYLKAYEDMKVTAGYEVKGKFIIKSKDGDCKTDTVTFRVIKVNGDWCYYGFSDSGSYGFNDDDEGVFYFLYDLLDSRWLYSSFGF